jgi:phospholipid/cholesterol/gamma-HCH transport system substrate-binding protein
MRRSKRRGLSFFQAGLILIILVVIGTYLGFTKSIPFRHHFTIKAVFHTSNNIRTNSFVRIAGVNVGKVTKVEHARKGEPDAILTMRVEDKGRPIHKDAFAVIRPRIFLEGNFFVDLHPGTPSEPVLGDGDTIQVSRTSTPVQFDQILTTLDSNTRDNLKRLLEEYSTGLSGTGGIGFNKSIQYWESAYKNSAIVNDATLGQQQHDLSGYINSAGTVAEALDRSPEALKSLITDLNTTANAFAREQDNLEQTVAELPRTLRAARPALAALNAAFPPLRRLVVDLRPAVRSSGPTIDASLPFVRQARKLVSKAELRGLVADLVPTVPALARLNNATVALLQQVRLASSCQNQVILPWSRDEIVDTNFPTKMGSGTIQLKVFEEGVRFLPAIAGESRTGDANGQWFRVLPGNGTNTYDLGLGTNSAPVKAVGQSLFPILGANPPKLGQPPVRPNVPCETQHKPDLRTTATGAPSPLARRSSPASKSVENESAAYIAATVSNQLARNTLKKPTPAQAKQLATTDKKLEDLRKKWVEDFKKMVGG